MTLSTACVSGEAGKGVHLHRGKSRAVSVQAGSITRDISSAYRPAAFPGSWASRDGTADNDKVRTIPNRFQGKYNIINGFWGRLPSDLRGCFNNPDGCCCLINQFFGNTKRFFSSDQAMAVLATPFRPHPDDEAGFLHRRICPAFSSGPC